jgi:hypothetical protein
MDTGISEIVGQGELDEGRSTKVYRALRSLLCATCGASIAQDTLFTRRKVKGIGLRIMPQCAKCAPFVLQTEKKSALLQSLLAESSADASKRASGSAQTDVQSERVSASMEKNSHDEVRRRLEPALKRGRRSRFRK